MPRLAIAYFVLATCKQLLLSALYPEATIIAVYPMACQDLKLPNGDKLPSQSYLWRLLPQQGCSNQLTKPEAKILLRPKALNAR